MSESPTKTCIFPGCERPAAPAHQLGEPQPSLCDLEAHNAVTAHQERQRVEPEAMPGTAQGDGGGPALSMFKYNMYRGGRRFSSG